jgi:hypothetical protein
LAGRAVLRVEGSLRVEETLLASGMSTNKSGEAVGLDGFVFEELNKAVGISIHVWEKIFDGRGGVVLPTNTEM